MIARAGSEWPAWILGPDTVRDEARALLDRAGEAAAVSEAYAAYYRRLVTRLVPEVERVREPAWLDRLEHEREDVRAAIAWLAGTGQADAAIDVAAAAPVLWPRWGAIAEGRATLEELLRVGGASPRARARAALAAEP